MTTDIIKQELETIRRNNEKGHLLPEEVVKFAENPNTALHKKFEWDDTEAARQHRLSQACAIIRVTVSVTQNGEEKVAVRTYVSLSDARRPYGGYRPRVEVVSDQEKRHRHALDVLTQVIGILERAHLDELQPVLDIAHDMQGLLALPKAS